MLVLSRKESEEICIGDDIVIMLVAIRGDKVRIGITAPDTVSIHRREIYDQIHGTADGTGGEDGDSDDGGAG